MHLKPTAWCQISTLIFEKKIMEGGLYEYPIKIYQWRQSSCPLGISIKGIVRAFNWLKCLGGFLHVKPTVGCQISTLIFYFFLWKGVSMNILWNIYQGLQIFCPLGVSIKDIIRFSNWFKCLGGFPHLKPTAWCQLSNLIFENKLRRGVSMNIPKKYINDGNVLAHLGF